MKLAIVSDLHIGYERFAEDSYKQAREALEKASEMADAILIPGDVFDKRAPKPEVIAKAINIFRDVSKKDWKARVTGMSNSNGNKRYTDVPILVIPGTHERTSEGKENVLTLLALAGLVVDISESTATVENDGEKLAVFGLGGLSEDRVKETLQRLDPKPLEGAFNVFMMHQSTYELLPFSDDIIRYDDLPKGFDLYVDGHIHSRVEAIVHGKEFLIPGSTVLTQLKDGEQEKKGFILFDTKDSKHEFIPIDSREFRTIHLKFDNAKPAQISDKCKTEIDNAIGKWHNPIIRLCIEGTLEDGYYANDLILRPLRIRYGNRAYLEFDVSKLKSPEMEKEIDSLRTGVFEGTSIKEIGIVTFLAKLKESKYDGKIDPGKLFEILSKDAKKESVLKEATSLLSEYFDP
ncbi:MAG: DNA repair exonuclease [Candidatus Marsarchaeota archaeon]|nr:DNA repair exonuclease [Candidatus Marsarchaeota archaeon]